MRNSSQVQRILTGSLKAGLMLIAASALSQEEPGAAEDAAALVVEYELIFPDEKAPETVKPEEVNPFVAVTDPEKKTDEANSEENLVKDRLLSLKVVGASPRPNGYRVQLGDMMLEPGVLVPYFFPDQTVQLRVNAITESDIEFVWLEKTRTGLPPRTLLVPIKIKPVVRYALPGGGGGTEAAMGTRDVANLRAAQQPLETPAPKRAIELDSEDTAKSAAEVKPKSPARPKSAADAVLDMFFNQGPTTSSR
jgi:hypothetical protein